MKTPRPFEKKIYDPKKLSRFLKSKKGLKVVFTNGCFDLLHRGHVTYLEKARKLGSFLVVALNDDASVQRLKGPTRPVNKLEDRLRVMAALECVDAVTWFTQDTPLETIQALRPKILVKGGDYKPETVVGGQEVKAWKGRVAIIPFVAGQSTTGILSRI